MPSALSMRTRHQIIEQINEGASLLSIAESLHLSYTTVRRISQRYNTQGIQALQPHYQHCGRPPACSNVLLYRAALYLKRHHRDWGAALIHLILHKRYNLLAVPTERTLQRWFKAHGMGRAKSRLNLPEPTWAQQVHDVWQIDAKEKLVLTSTQRVCYLSVVDEKSGCLLSAQVFPPLPYQ